MGSWLNPPEQGTNHCHLCFFWQKSLELRGDGSAEMVTGFNERPELLGGILSAESVLSPLLHCFCPARFYLSRYRHLLPSTSSQLSVIPVS